MSNRILRHLLPIGGAMLLSLAATMPARADVGADAHTCYVRGDASACEKLHPQSGTEMDTQVVVPGVYARYLINLGSTPDVAIAQARRIGEEPTVRVVSHGADRQLTGLEAYEREQGRGSL